jgi:multiple sugar transport system permease protein
VPREIEEAAVIDGARFPGSDFHLSAGDSTGDRDGGVVRFHHLVERIPRRIGHHEPRRHLHLPLILANARQETSIGGTDWGLLQAGITISIIPCVLFYLLLQKYYVSGFTSGAVK